MQTPTPTITKKQAKNTLSGKKKRKVDVIKHVLAKPYENYWPLLTPEDNNQLTENISRFLPRIKVDKFVIPYNKIKEIPKDERKKFRETLNENNQELSPESERDKVVFGVNDSAVLIENREAASVLIASDVQPRLLVQHIVDMAVLHSIPVLVVHDLRTVCLKKSGVSAAVVALKKSVSADSELGLLRQTICNVYENYPVPETHINYNRRDATTITITDDDASVYVVSDDEEIVEEKNYHLKREGRKRAFVPEKSEIENVVDFISLDTTTESPFKEESKRQYHPLVVQRVKGDKDRNKRKLQKFKRMKK